MTRLDLQLKLAKIQAATARLKKLTNKWDAAMAAHEAKLVTVQRKAA